MTASAADECGVSHSAEGGLNRQAFLRLMAVGGPAAAAALSGLPREAAAQAPLRLFFKADYPEYFHKPWATELGRPLVRLHELHHADRALLRAQPLRLAGRQPRHLEL